MTERDAARREEYVARNVAIEIAPGRYSRDTWVRERWFERERQPKRSTEGKAKDGKHIKPVAAAVPKKKGPGPMPKTAVHDCPLTKGHYVMTCTEPNPAGRGFQVIAVCKAGHCAGRARKFGVHEWIKHTPGYACGACSNQIRKQQRHQTKSARKAAGLPMTNVYMGGRR